MFLSSALLGEQRQRAVSLVGENQIAHEKRGFSISLRISDSWRAGVTHTGPRSASRSRPGHNLIHSTKHCPLMQALHGFEE